MRSSHSLAFQQFEQVISLIKIKSLDTEDPEVIEVLRPTGYSKSQLLSPFKVVWKSESDWDTTDQSQQKSGCCLLIPIPTSKSAGKMIRSIGYAEEVGSISTYSFHSDGTFELRSKYGQAIAEERIWFVSENIRCRFSAIRTSAGSGILQTSFSSEVRRLTSPVRN